MAVYVDDMYTIPMGQFRNMKMSHMVADTKQELLEMADKIGVNREWIQHEGTVLEHFDVSISKRNLAIQHGAIAITMLELGRMNLAKRKTHYNANKPTDQLNDQ